MPFSAFCISPASASLAGTLLSKNHITRLAAVDRAWADVLKTSALDPKDQFLYAGTINDQGQFHFDNLLAGRSYDLIVWTTTPGTTAGARGGNGGGVTRWEGVNMDYHRPIIPSTAATAEDRKAVEALVTDVPQFYDKVRPLKIAADHQHATVLVELIRTRDFHSEVGGAGGEVIYRVELWYFENLFGGWAKDANTEKVVARVRGKPSDLQQSWQFLPQLGNLPALPPPVSTTPITLPDQPDPKLGITAGIK
jgi:hypothetical protein